MAKCPVCEMQTENDNERLCLRCGWEFKYILGGMSQEEEAIYNRKLEICRQNWHTLQALKNELQALKDQQKPPQANKPDPPDTTKQKEAEPPTESRPANALYSEETPIPDIRREPFETVEEFQERLSEHKPVPAGKATLIKEKYDIETGRFPIDVSWEDWTRNVRGIPGSDMDLYLIAERDLARAIYGAGPAYSLFVRLGAEGETVFAREPELSTGKGALPVKVLKGGDVWTEQVTGMEFIYVPKGTFMMGDTFGEGYDNEKPVHEVQLDGFYIGKYPVTQGQWKKVTGNNPSYFQEGDDYPVECVSWEDVQEFVRKLTGMNRGKYKFRLSTEAEWEYAARSGGKKEIYAGGDDVDAVAWCYKNSGKSTHLVGKKAPNSLGIHDMSGNVWEWCQDWFGDYPSGSVKNPVRSFSGSSRVVRGGSWYDSAGYCRSAFRNWHSPGERDRNLGFRLALSMSVARQEGKEKGSIHSHQNEMDVE